MDYRDPEWVAERLGVDKNTLYKFLHDGVLPAIQLGRKWLISESRLVRWLEEETERQTSRRKGSTVTAERAVKRMQSLSARSRGLLRQGYALARRWNHRHLGQEHLLAAMAGESDTSAGRLLREGGITAESVEKAIQPPAIDPAGPPRRMGRKPRTRRAMRLAAAEAQRLGTPLAEPEHLLLGILLAGPSRATGLLSVGGISIDHVRAAINPAAPKKRSSKEKS